MLKLKEPSGEGIIIGKKVIIIRIRKSQKLDCKYIKKSPKLHELIVISIYNPRFCKEFNSILRVKEYNLRWM